MGEARSVQVQCCKRLPSEAKNLSVSARMSVCSAWRDKTKGKSVLQRAGHRLNLQRVVRITAEGETKQNTGTTMFSYLCLEQKGGRGGEGDFRQPLLVLRRSLLLSLEQQRA